MQYLLSVFLDILFGQYFGPRIGKKKINQKYEMITLSPVFVRKYFPWCHVRFMINESHECEIKVSIGYYSSFYTHMICRNLLEAMVSRVFPTQM